MIKIGSGRIDYNSGLTPVHPFILRCPNLPKRDLLQVFNRIKNFQKLATILVGIIFCNILMMFFIVYNNMPVIYIETILNSGKIYQKGVLKVPPLDNKLSKQFLHIHNQLIHKEK